MAFFTKDPPVEPRNYDLYCEEELEKMRRSKQHSSMPPHATRQIKPVDMRCPSCGAPTILEDHGRIMLCPYCGSKHFLSIQDDEFDTESDIDDTFEAECPPEQCPQNSYQEQSNPKYGTPVPVWKSILGGILSILAILLYIIIWFR